MKLNDILLKLLAVETNIEEIDDILSVTFYSDGSGSVASASKQYFEFENPTELKEFLKMDNKYIVKKARRYPL